MTIIRVEAKMNGQIVVVREYGGNPVICKIWSMTEEKVFVCTIDAFEKLVALGGNKFLPNCFPVGFPKGDVFHFKPNVDLQDPLLWSKLIAYA
jgi:hypothetical protein